MTTRQRVKQQREAGTAKTGAGRWAGEFAAIYCRISQARDEDQTKVDRQERLCREVAKRLGLVVRPEFVFVDNNRSAWQRNRKRPGWDALLEAMGEGRFGHVLVYHPDRLMRQPRDLEELLSIADDQHVTLHGQANRRDLSDPDDRFFLRIEVAHSCRSSDDTSRRARAAMEDHARAGRPHGCRSFGYQSNNVDIDEDEAAVVREVFDAYVNGTSTVTLARRLNERGVTTVTGKQWTRRLLRDLLANRHVAGIRVFRGEDFGEGNWPPIVDRGVWEEVQQLLSYRAAQAKEKADRAPKRFYLLRGIVMCKRCGVRMAGSSNGYYMCPHERPGPKVCGRSINATKLEEFVSEAAIEQLTEMDISGARRTVALSEEDQAAVDRDEMELEELRQGWEAEEFNTNEYREMRKVVQARIDARRKKVVVARPTAEVLTDMVGPHAREIWNAKLAAGELERLNAVLRFLFQAVIIDEYTAPRRAFDYQRIKIVPNPLD